MKNVVSIFATFALLTLISASSAFGQMMPPVEGAVPMGTFRVQVSKANSEPDLTYSVAEGGGASILTTSWLVEGGETVYTLDVNSAEFSMPCGWAKNMPMSDMMDMFGKAAIRKGLEMGFSHIGPDCENDIVDVYYPTCISRSTGFGCPNLTAAPGTDYSRNGYTVCGEIFNPMITLVYTIRGMSVCGEGYQDSMVKTTVTKSAETKSSGKLRNLVGSLLGSR